MGGKSHARRPPILLPALSGGSDGRAQARGSPSRLPTPTNVSRIGLRFAKQTILHLRPYRRPHTRSRADGTRGAGRASARSGDVLACPEPEPPAQNLHARLPPLCKCVVDGIRMRSRLADLGRWSAVFISHDQLVYILAPSG